MGETISEGLIDAIPFAASETQYAVIVDADVDETFNAIRGTDLSTSRTVKALVRLRSLPLRIRDRLLDRPRETVVEQATISDLIDAGVWIVLSEHPPHELTLGLVMWDERILADGLSHRAFADPGRGSVKVGWSFRVQPLQGHRTLLVTETRTAPTDRSAARRFRLYWRLMSPFASLTRRHVLRMIAAEAARIRASHREPIRLAA
jgi:hypothetical protein